jgi:hypothetical protein
VLAVGAAVLDAAALDTLADELLALDVAAELLLEAALLDDADDEVLLDASLLETDELAAALLTEAALLEAPPPAAGALSLPPPPQAEISAKLNTANPASLYCLFITQSLYKVDAVLFTWTALRRYVSDFLQMESGDM